MTSSPTGVDRDAAILQARVLLRDAIATEYPRLFQALAPLVRSILKTRSDRDIALKIEDVLGETVFRAMSQADTYQIGRPVILWLLGIARNVLVGEAREETRHHRVTVEDWSWDRLMGFIESPEVLSSALLDVRDYLAKLSEPERRALESRFLKELTGRDLAEALGAPSEGAARVRVTRALQILQRLISPEVSR